MNEAGVLAAPAQARGHGQRALDHWPGVNISARLEAAELRMKPRVESLEPLEQHLVIIARPASAVCIFTTRPRVARNPRAPVLRFFRRARPRRVVIRKTHQRRARP